MTIMTTRRVAFLLFFLLVFASLAAASSHLPVGILKAQQYNEQLAADFLQNVSFFIAFLAGMTTVLSPCILPLLPAFFAVTFKEKRQITRATSTFFAGFAVVFIGMGMAAAYTGKTLITLFANVPWLVPLMGVFLILFGVMVVLGKGFTGLRVASKTGHDWKGLLGMGAIFAIGWTACVGPILSGVLLMAATFHNYGTAALLMLFYSLGIFVPLFLLSFFYDSLHLHKIAFLHKHLTFRLGGKEFQTTYPNLIAGIFFLLLGTLFIFFRGTAIVNGLQMFGLRRFFYDWQHLFLTNASLFNYIGMALLAALAVIFVLVVRKEMKERENRSGVEKK